MSPELVERFRREIKLARRVTHPNVARVFDIGAHGQQPFLTMELIDGVSLAEIIARRGSLPPQEVHSTATALCGGLSAAHAAGVVHRDLKPENVLVEHSGRVVITDFGVACALSERDMPYGTAGALVGSPAYMSPEQVEGVTDPDARADIYAVGVILYELLTGAMPWDGGSVFAVAAARLVRAPPDPRSSARPTSPAPYAQIVMPLYGAAARGSSLATVEEVGERLREELGGARQDLDPAADLRTYVGAPCFRPHHRADADREHARRRTPSYFARGYTSEIVPTLLGACCGILVRAGVAAAVPEGEGVRDVAPLARRAGGR